MFTRGDHRGDRRRDNRRDQLPVVNTRDDCRSDQCQRAKSDFMRIFSVAVLRLAQFLNVEVV